MLWAQPPASTQPDNRSREDMNRRDFLKTGSLALVSAILLGCRSAGPTPTAVNRPTRRPTPPAAGDQPILVVGAGIAGLAAARELHRQGREVLVIEARDRIGGRIWTDTAWSDRPLDLGASWIHGVTGNPITELAAQSGARTVTTDYDNAVIYDTTGAPLDRSGELRLERLADDIARVLREAQDGDRDQAVQAAVEAGLPWSALSPAERIEARFILNSTLEQEYAGSTAELSTYWFDADGGFKGGDVLLPAGYGQIVDDLAAGIPLALGQTVREVRVTEEAVTIATETDTYTGPHAIVTLPLGVLKTGKVAFSPALPAPTQRSIDALGMGVLNKCYLRFPAVFWPEVDWLEYVARRNGHWVEWLSLARPAQQPVLLGFNAADFGREIEAWSDEQIVADALRTLRVLFGRQVPDPVGFQITRWASDPFARGSYSFNALSSTPDMRDELARSIDGRLHLAGEATHREYFGTVHGAYLSGLRAAQDSLRP